MGNYILRRILGIIPLLLGISIITFSVIHLAPGKPTDLQTQLNPNIPTNKRETGKTVRIGQTYAYSVYCMAQKNN